MHTMLSQSETSKRQIFLLLALFFPALPAGAGENAAQGYAADRTTEAAFTEDKQGCHRETQGEDGAWIFQWKGTCKNGYPDGPGVMTSMPGAGDPGRVTEKESVTYHDRMREGPAVVEYQNNQVMLRSEFNYLHGSLDGKAVVYYTNGDKAELRFEKGKNTHHGKVISKNGDLFEGELLDEGRAKGKWTYANGDVYEGEKLFDAMHGQGVYTSKDGDKQAGEFIMNQFLDVKDETAARLMPGWFGLKLGMTRKQVEARVGKMKVSARSSYRNAFDVEKFPDEKFAIPSVTIIQRTVYFDEHGKLWRIWVKFAPNDKEFFGGDDAMRVYGAIRRYLTLNSTFLRSYEPYPFFNQGIANCSNTREWERDYFKSYERAELAAPLLTRAQRVVFDIGCGALPFWQSTFISRDGKEAYFVGMRDGTLYTTPVVYTAARADETAMQRKMAKNPPDNTASAADAAAAFGTQTRLD